MNKDSILWTLVKVGGLLLGALVIAIVATANVSDPFAWCIVLGLIWGLLWSLITTKIEDNYL